MADVTAAPETHVLIERSRWERVRAVAARAQTYERVDAERSPAASDSRKRDALAMVVTGVWSLHADDLSRIPDPDECPPAAAVPDAALLADLGRVLRHLDKTCVYDELEEAANRLRDWLTKMQQGVPAWPRS